MVNNLQLQKESFVYKKRRRLERNIKKRAKRRVMLSLMISLGLITLASFFITHNLFSNLLQIQIIFYKVIKVIFFK